MPVPFDRQRSNLAWVEGRVSSGHSTARDPALSTYWDHTHIYVLRPYFDLQLPNFAKWRNYRTGDFLHGSCRPDPNGDASGGQTFLGLGPPISYRSTKDQLRHGNPCTEEACFSGRPPALLPKEAGTSDPDFGNPHIMTHSNHI